MDALSARQLGLLVFAAMAGPTVVLCGTVAWPAALIGTGVALPFVYFAARVPRSPKWLGGGYQLWTLVLMAKTAAISGACFSDEIGFVPVILLVLAAVCGRSGLPNAGRLGALLWPTIAALLLALLGSACADFHWTRFVLACGERQGWMTVAGLFMSLSILMVKIQTKEKYGVVCNVTWLIVALGVGTSAISCGVLGKLRKDLTQPVYEIARGVSVLGVADRLEALLSVALTISLFLTLSLLCAIGPEGDKEGIENRHVGSWWRLLGALVLIRPIELLPAWVWLVFPLAIKVIEGTAMLCAKKGREEKRRKRGKK